MKTIRLSLLTAVLALCANAASFTIDTVALVKGVKNGLTTQSKWHRAVYAAELLGATISLGVDGGSTEYALSHGKLWEAACTCYVQVAHEADPLFLKRDGSGSLSQVRLWMWKGVLGAAPFGLSYASHKLFPDSTLVDASLVGLIGVADFYYFKAGVSNIHIGSEIEAANKAVGH